MVQQPARETRLRRLPVEFSADSGEIVKALSGSCRASTHDQAHWPPRPLPTPIDGLPALLPFRRAYHESPQSLFPLCPLPSPHGPANSNSYIPKQKARLRASPSQASLYSPAPSLCFSSVTPDWILPAPWPEGSAYTSQSAPHSPQVSAWSVSPRPFIVSLSLRISS